MSQRSLFCFITSQGIAFFVAALASTAAVEAGPAISIADALKLVDGGRRVTVRGTVMAETAPGFFFLRDDTGRIRGRLEEPIDMHPGDLIELEAEPVTKKLFVWLENGSARVCGRGVFPQPLLLDAKECYASPEAHLRLDSEFVTVRGIVSGRSVYKDRYRIRGEWVEVPFHLLDVDQDGTLVRVFFHPEDKPWERFGIGTEAEFTGVCRLSSHFPEEGEGPVHVLLPTPASVHILVPPPFLERPVVQECMRIVLIVLAVIIAIGVTWALGQRRKVAAMRASEERYRLLNLSLENRVADRTSELAAALTQQTELTKLKTDFVSLVSHEFRTPLGVIMSAVDVLRRYFDRLSPEKRERHLDMIFHSTRNLAMLIEEVLLLGRVEEGRVRFSPVPHDLDKLCRVLTDELLSATAGECPIDYRASGDLGEAMVDEALLRHIILNLLSNAVKYSETGQRVEFAVSREGGDAVFVIRDHGIGIPLKDQSRIFTSFTRGSNVGTRPGTGLGLVIVQRCVLLHGGVIALDSSPGEGTTMTVTLPVFSHHPPFNPTFTP